AGRRACPGVRLAGAPRPRATDAAVVVRSTRNRHQHTGRVIARLGAVRPEHVPTAVRAGGYGRLTHHLGFHSGRILDWLAGGLDDRWPVAAALWLPRALRARWRHPDGRLPAAAGCLARIEPARAAGDHDSARS